MDNWGLVCSLIKLKGIMHKLLYIKIGGGIFIYHVQNNVEKNRKIIIDWIYIYIYI